MGNLFLSWRNILSVWKLKTRWILNIIVWYHKVLIIHFLSLNISHIRIGMAGIYILRTFYLLNSHLLMLRMNLTFAFNCLLIKRILAAIFKTWYVIPSILFNWKCPWWFFNHHPAAQLSVMVWVIIFVLT